MKVYLPSPDRSFVVDGFESVGGVMLRPLIRPNRGRYGAFTVPLERPCGIWGASGSWLLAARIERSTKELRLGAS